MRAVLPLAGSVGILAIAYVGRSVFDAFLRSAGSVGLGVAPAVDALSRLVMAGLLVALTCSSSAARGIPWSASR
jgi:hypothetical protein